MPSGGGSSPAFGVYQVGVVDPFISLKGDGSINAAGDTAIGANTTGSSSYDRAGAYIGKEGYISLFKTQADTSSSFLTGKKYGTTDPLFQITGSGSATFSGSITAAGNQFFVQSDGATEMHRAVTDTSQINVQHTLRGGYKTTGGNNTTTWALLADGSLEAEGSLTAAGNVIIGGDPTSGTNPGIKLWANQGAIYASGDTAGQNLFLGYTTGSANETVSITAAGAATFAGSILSTNGTGNVYYNVSESALLAYDSNANGSVPKVRINKSGSATFAGALEAESIDGGTY